MTFYSYDRTASATYILDAGEGKVKVKVKVTLDEFI